MSYAGMGPLGGTSGPDSSSEAALRTRLRGHAVSIWNDYQRLRRQGPVRELMAIEPYSSSAFSTAYRRLRSAAAERLPSVRVSKREFASMLQAAMAKISILQIKARSLSYAADIRAAAPAADRVNRAAQRLLASVRRLVAEASPIRKGATSGQKEGTAGLGFIFATVAIASFVLSTALVIVYTESMRDADAATQYANETCARLQRANGRPCGADEWQEAYQEAVQLREESGVRGLLRDTGRGTADAIQDITESPIGTGIGTGFMIAMTVGAVAVVGLGAYAAWPYLTGIRGVGKRFSRKAEPGEGHR